MDVSSKGVRLSVAGLAIVGWLVLIGATLHRIVNNHAEPWCMAVSLIAAVVAITATVVLTIICTLPDLFAAWSRGVAYGQQHRPVERAAVPSQRGRSLHSV